MDAELEERCRKMGSMESVGNMGPRCSMGVVVTCYKVMTELSVLRLASALGDCTVVEDKPLDIHWLLIW